jgi:hypothetical protein
MDFDAALQYPPDFPNKAIKKDHASGIGRYDILPELGEFTQQSNRASFPNGFS